MTKRRDTILQVRLRDAEANVVAKIAEREQRTVSSYLRYLVMQDIEKRRAALKQSLDYGAIDAAGYQRAMAELEFAENG